MQQDKASSRKSDNVRLMLMTTAAVGATSLVLHAVRAKLFSRSPSSGNGGSSKLRLRRAIGDLHALSRGGKGQIDWQQLVKTVGQAVQLCVPSASVLRAYIIARDPATRLKTLHWVVCEEAEGTDAREALESALGLCDRALNGLGVGVPSSERCLLQKSILDSALSLGAISEFADWTLAADKGASRSITVPLVALDHRLGSLHLHLTEAPESEADSASAELTRTHSTSSASSAPKRELVDHPSLMTVGEACALALLAMDGAQVNLKEEPIVNVFATAATGSATVDLSSGLDLSLINTAASPYHRLRRNLSNMSKPDSAKEFGSEDADTPIALYHGKGAPKVYDLSGRLSSSNASVSSASSAAHVAFPRFPSEEQPLDETHEDVTLLVADVHDLETLVEADTAEADGVLKTLFSRFREAAERFGVETAEMMGDSFVAMSNLFKRDPNHARTILRLGAELSRCAEGLAIAGHQLHVRVGVSTGPLSGGSLGRVRPQYVVVGPDVLVAAKLEQTARLGTVHFAVSSLQAAKCRTNARGLTERLIRVRGVGPNGAPEYRRTYTCKVEDLESVLSF